MAAILILSVIGCTGPPANDDCSDAVAVGGEGLFAFNNGAATTDGPGHMGCENAGGDDQIAKDVWYRWKATCAGQVYVRTCGMTEGVDTRLAVYDGAACPANTGRLLACNDDSCGYKSDGTGGRESQLSFAAAEGREYLIRVGVFPGNDFFPAAEGGSGRFEITCGVPDQPTCQAPGRPDCCLRVGRGSREVGCDDPTCCKAVCACDAFCCEVEWDAGCARTGFEGSGCGAETLCGGLCRGGR